VARRVSGICISATDEHALVAPVERAIQAGIPVTVFDSAVDIGNYVSFIATDNYQAGCTAARILAGLVRNQGKVAMVMQKPGGTSTVLRERGFEATMNAGFEDVRIAAKQFGMADPARSRAAAEDILTAHPDLAGMFASSEAASIGCIQAIRGRNLSGKIKLVTFDFSSIHIDALKDGTADVMLCQDPGRIGYEAVKSMADKLAGRTPIRRLEIPVREIRAADLDKPDVRALLYQTG
jgi:ribose transport system substrate-binding protein